MGGVERADWPLARVVDRDLLVLRMGDVAGDPPDLAGLVWGPIPEEDPPAADGASTRSAIHVCTTPARWW